MHPYGAGDTASAKSTMLIAVVTMASRCWCPSRMDSITLWRSVWRWPRPLNVRMMEDDRTRAHDEDATPLQCQRCRCGGLVLQIDGVRGACVSSWVEVGGVWVFTVILICIPASLYCPMLHAKWASLVPVLTSALPSLIFLVFIPLTEFIFRSVISSHLLVEPR